VGGPYQDEQAAMASVGGAVPPDEELVHGSGAMATGSDADSVYVLQRIAIVAGTDFPPPIRAPIRTPGNGRFTLR